MPHGWSRNGALGWTTPRARQWSWSSSIVAPGTTWSAPVKVSNAPLNVTIFTNLAAGDPGRIAVGYYGTTAKAATPDAVKRGEGGWSPYVAVSTDALCQWDAKPCKNGPAFQQSAISAHINQDDNICTSGTTCVATMGNRNLADYFDLNIDPQGHLIAVWSDAYNRQTAPLLPYYADHNKLVEVDGMAAIDTVAAAIDTALDAPRW